MKKVIGIVVGALLCSLAATALADESVERISRIGVADGNIALLNAVDGSFDGNNCVNQSGGSRNTLVIDISTESGRQMYHTALAAYLAGQQIKVFNSTCRTVGSYVWPQASRVDVATSF